MNLGITLSGTNAQTWYKKYQKLHMIKHEKTNKEEK